MRTKAIGDPDPVLLVDRKVERRLTMICKVRPIRPSQTAPALGRIALGEVNELILPVPTAQTSPLGVTMIPCISPSLPSNVMPSGGVSGLPFLSNTAIDLPP